MATFWPGTLKVEAKWYPVRSNVQRCFLKWDLMTTFYVKNDVISALMRNVKPSILNTSASLIFTAEDCVIVCYCPKYMLWIVIAYTNTLRFIESNRKQIVYMRLTFRNIIHFYNPKVDDLHCRLHPTAYSAGSGLGPVVGSCNTVMNLSDRYMTGNFLMSCMSTSSRRAVCSTNRFTVFPLTVHKQNRGNGIMKTFIICTLRQIMLSVLYCDMTE
jgi:hypothetical protein